MRYERIKSELAGVGPFSKRPSRRQLAKPRPTFARRGLPAKPCGLLGPVGPQWDQEQLRRLRTPFPGVRPSSAAATPEYRQIPKYCLKPSHRITSKRGPMLIYSQPCGLIKPVATCWDRPLQELTCPRVLRLIPLLRDCISPMRPNKAWWDRLRPTNESQIPCPVTAG